MKQKIIIFIISLSVILSITATFISASNNYNPNEYVFTIASKRPQETSLAKDYNIKQYPVDGFTGFGDFRQEDGFLYNYLGSGYESGGWNEDTATYEIPLFNDTYFLIRIIDSKWSLYYGFADFYDSTFPDNYLICGPYDFYHDVLFYINYVGQLKYCIFENGPNAVTYDSFFDEDINFYGFMFPYGQVPNDEQAYQNGYNTGYNDGFYEGYQDGISDTVEDAYNKGFTDGQDSTNIPSLALTGFFTGLTNFFAPFFSIGIGSLTIGNMLFLLIATFIAIMIARIIWGR